MPQAFLNNSIVILLTIVSVCSSPRPSLFVIAAGLLMVLCSYASFEDKTDRRITAVRLLLMGAYAVLSGSFIGFAVFLLADELRALYRVLVSIGLYLAVSALPAAQSGQTFAVTMIRAMLLASLLAALYAIKRAVFAVQNRQARDADRLRTSNLNELHARQLNEQLIRSHYMADKNARLLERENISRSIHNSVGHSITAAIMTLDAADLLYDVRPEDARKKMQDANERIRGSLDSIRRAVRLLDEDSPAIAAADLKGQMRDIIDNFQMDSERRVQFDFGELSDECPILHEHAEFLTGALEELLSNGVRHGRADFFTVLLTGDNAHIRLSVSDNGTSDFDGENSDRRIANGFGLKKMISYADRCGGKAEFANANGFRAVVELPLPSPTDKD